MLNHLKLYTPKRIQDKMSVIQTGLPRTGVQPGLRVRFLMAYELFL